jgi:hypothetical protein
MRKINWGAVEVLGDVSGYVTSLESELEGLVPTYRGILSATYFRNFCSKLAVELLDKYLGYIKRQKKINAIGIHLMLVRDYLLIFYYDY